MQLRIKGARHFDGF